MNLVETPEKPEKKKPGRQKKEKKVAPLRIKLPKKSSKKAKQASSDDDDDFDDDDNFEDQERVRFTLFREKILTEDIRQKVCLESRLHFGLKFAVLKLAHFCVNRRKSQPPNRSSQNASVHAQTREIARKMRTLKRHHRLTR